MSDVRRPACQTAVPPSGAGRALAPEKLSRGTLAPSKVSKWRAGVLIGIHVLAALHIWHWSVRGESLSPLEPSEGMYTVADGVVNAGVILLGLALLSTVVLGRWFCGWACHLVALQDFCAYLLMKIGIRPRPLRSRVLMWIPLLAGIYMFAWPAILRAWRGTTAPELHLGLTKTGFWDTFPGWGVALFTFFVCGFALVYFLGAKGFCTYACPYGGLFAALEPLSPFRIRVTDACKHCGHCSAACTSNVDVASEVHRFGMVVDKGCMKCGDCVSVCPENALYLGFGKPAVAKRSRIQKPISKPRHYTRWEEATMLIVFFFTLFALHGLPELASKQLIWLYEDVQLYARMPLLLALALAGLTAFCFVHWLSLVRRSPAEQRFQDHPLFDEAGRRTRAGWIAMSVTSALLLLVGHSIWVQVHMFEGGRLLEQTVGLGNAPWEQRPGQPLQLTPELRQDIQNGEWHLARAESLALLPDVRIATRRAWFALLRGDLKNAEKQLDLAIERQPTWPSLVHERARLSLVQNNFADAERYARASAALSANFAPARRLLAGIFMQRGEPRLAAQALREVIAHHPQAIDARAQLITCLEVAAEPRTSEIEKLITALGERPGHAQAAPLSASEHLLRAGAAASALDVLHRYLADHPRDVRAAELLSVAYSMRQDEAQAAEWQQRAELWRSR